MRRIFLQFLGNQNTEASSAEYGPFRSVRISAKEVLVDGIEIAIREQWYWRVSSAALFNRAKGAALPHVTLSEEDAENFFSLVDITTKD